MKLPLQSFRLKNFKAIQDTGTVRFTPLTVLIGNNGSGKSSLIEGLETLWNFVTRDLNHALGQWHGFEHIRNKTQAIPRKAQKTALPMKAIEFSLQGHADGFSMATDNTRCAEDESGYGSHGIGRPFACRSLTPYASATRLNLLPGISVVCVESETLTSARKFRVTRDPDGRVLGSEKWKARHNESILSRYVGEHFGTWQFLNMAVP